jgi:chaperonin GroEL
VNTLANAVKATLGPKGWNVGLDKEGGAPTITKDGMTVRATGLAESIVREAMMKNVTPDAKPMAVKRGIDKAVVGERTPRAKPTTGKKEIAQGATISANVVQH